MLAAQLVISWSEVSREIVNFTHTHTHTHTHDVFAGLVGIRQSG